VNTKPDPKPSLSRNTNSTTPEFGLIQPKISSSADQVIDWSWLDFDTEHIPESSTWSPPNLSPGSGTSAGSVASPASISTRVKSEPLSESPHQTPRIEIASSDTSHQISLPLEEDLLHVESHLNLQKSLKGPKTIYSNDNGSINTTSSSARSLLSLGSLKKRLQSKYSGSFLHDIKSLMDRLTISEASDSSSIMTKPAYHSRRSVPSALAPAIILPGFFPQYCWEHLNANEFLRCDDLPLPCSQGPIYSPLGLETHRAMRSDVMFRIRSSSVRRDDISCTDAFGNTVLHVATTLGARPSYLSRLVTMGADVHKLNVAGQTFLHLIYLSDIHHLAEFRFLLGTLIQKGFNFEQQDDNGQTIFHGLIQSCMPNEIVDDAIQCFQYHGINLPKLRDNLGFDVSRRALRRPTFEMLPPPAEDDESIYRSMSMTSNVMSTMDEYSSPSYVHLPIAPVSPFIENLEDLQNYEFHADLLRTILRATDIPSFEDTNGRNGLHCLAAVRLDLPVSTTDTENDAPVSKSTGSDITLRERYLEQLLVSGVDPNTYDRQGNTAFMSFVADVREEEDDNLTSKILDRLCRAGANIHRRNRKGETPLHIAVKLGRRAATKFLLARGANVHARTSDGIGILSLGLKHSDRASQDDVLYAQISLCISLVAGAGAVSAPTILREWASEEFRIAPDPLPAAHKRSSGGLKDDGEAVSVSASNLGEKGYYGKEIYGSWSTLKGKSWAVGGA
jgi:ankyrin repeat protein